MKPSPVAKKRKQTNFKKKPVVAYEILDKHIEGGKISILKTANAWWKDRIKVKEMLDGRRMGMKWPEVQYLCGISETQREYFFKIHPELLHLFHEAQQFQTILARKNFHKQLEAGDKDTTRFYLERKLPDEFKEKKEIDLNKPVLIDDLIGDKE